MGLALDPQEVQTESNNPVTEDVKYLLKESAIRVLVKFSSIEMFEDAAFLSPGKTFFIVFQKALWSFPLLSIRRLCLYYSVRHTISMATITRPVYGIISLSTLRMKVVPLKHDWFDLFVKPRTTIYPSHMSLFDGCMAISNRDKSAFEIVPQLIHIGHKPSGNKGITHTFQILAKINWIIIS